MNEKTKFLAMTSSLVSDTTNRVRRHKSAGLILVLLFILIAVGSDAGALPSISKSYSNKSAKKNCSAVSVGECIPRGGSDASIFSQSSAAAEQMKSMGTLGAWVSFRSAIFSSVQTFWRDAQRTKFLLSGAVAGIVSRTCVSPLEVIATSQMVRGGNSPIWKELVELFQGEGVKGFFKGNGANCLKVAPTRGVQFIAFESFKTTLVGWKRQRLGLEDTVEVSLTPLERLAAGGFAGMLASSMVYPLEVVKTMLTMYPGKYPGIGAAFQGVLKEAGPSGFYKGLAPTLVAMFPYVGVEFMIYESCKIAIEKILESRRVAGGQYEAAVYFPTIISLGLGALAGAAAQCSAHPLDVVRKRLQVQGINGNPMLYKSTLGCFAGVASKEGLSALYKGLGPACVATIPGTGIAYITYEAMKRVLGLSSV